MNLNSKLNLNVNEMSAVANILYPLLFKRVFWMEFNKKFINWSNNLWYMNLKYFANIYKWSKKNWIKFGFKFRFVFEFDFES